MEPVMKPRDRAFFHRLYGRQRPRVEYYPKDFVDYTLMLGLCALAAALTYGRGHAMTAAAAVLCALTLAAFAVRHGIEWRMPLLVRRPQDVLYMVVYKLQNLRPAYFAALALLLAENAFIAATPRLPHQVALMRAIALTLFYVHLAAITLYRTASLVDHLSKRELVREVLMQTPWKRTITARTNITREILHAYVTGLLTHIVLLAPWYLVITHARFSVLVLPAACAADALVHVRWAKAINSWFYRDHWVGHNSELEFVFLHGTHHDAIPCGLIAVAGNGFLEGFLRYTIGSPVAFYNPIMAFLVYMFDVKTDIELHQYIPGVFPRLPRRVLEVGQHSTHHYGRLEPYSFGLKLDQPSIPEAFKRRMKWAPDELMNSLELDEELTGFQWENATHANTLDLWDRYHQRFRSM
jgi:hypothetical protein